MNKKITIKVKSNQMFFIPPYLKDGEPQINFHIRLNRKLKFSVHGSFVFLVTFISAERLAEDLNPGVPKMPSESASDSTAPKVT